MPGMPGSADRPAGAAEVWAARAWNVFNEGRPFSVVYPLLVLLAAAVVGLAPDGSLGPALLGAAASALVLARFPFALRGRALLWLAAVGAVPVLEPWRAPLLLAGALAAGRLRRGLEAKVKDDPAVQELLDEVVSRRLDPASAAAKLLEREGG
jgi:hypothetical protein